MAPVTRVKARPCTPVGYEVVDKGTVTEAVTAGDQLRPIGKPDQHRGLARPPMRKHARADVTAHTAKLSGPVDFIANPQFGDRLLAAIAHQHPRFAIDAVRASVLASAIRVDRLREGDVC